VPCIAERQVVVMIIRNLKYAQIERNTDTQQTRQSARRRFHTHAPGQLSLLPSAGRDISTNQSAVMLYGWEVKAGWLIPYVDKCLGGR